MENTEKVQKSKMNEEFFGKFESLAFMEYCLAYIIHYKNKVLIDGLSMTPSLLCLAHAK